MSNQTSQHGKPEEQEGFEHRDLNAASIVYFLVTLGVITGLCLFALKGLYSYLDHRERASQSPVNPLVTDVPEDTRHVAPGYPQSAFPSPKLEEDERGQLNGIRLREEKTLYSYGWVDEKAGIVRIPIERAMDLLVERGLPVRPQGVRGEDRTADTGPTTAPTAEAGAGAKDEKK
jgi:hypothetical protein